MSISVKVENYINAGNPLLNVVTHEEARATGQILKVCEKLRRTLIVWSPRTSAVRLTSPHVYKGQDTPMKALEAIAGYEEKTVIILKDFHVYLKNPTPILLRAIREISLEQKAFGKIIIFMGCKKNIPDEISKEVTVIDVPLPDREALKKIVVEVSEFLPDPELHLKEDNPIVTSMANAATGMTAAEAENSISLSIVETGNWTPSIVYREKCQVVKRSNILEILPAVETMESVGGLEEAIKYIKTRKNCYSDEARAAFLPMPKGLLLVGVPGSGKSLLARVIAHELGVPLIRFDVGRVYSGIVGSSENNMRTVMSTAEAVAPGVLFIDELDKGFSGTGKGQQSSSDVTKRIFGSFLSWMNDKTSPVYIVATANDVSALPPEFLRKGRFDEIFFCDLPNAGERKQIWDIQLKKHHQKKNDYKVVALAKNSQGFTGAEIEQSIIDAMWHGFSYNKKPGDCIAKIIEETVPLSKTMPEKILEMQEWARSGRARMATSEPVSRQTGKRQLSLGESLSA